MIAAEWGHSTAAVEWLLDHTADWRLKNNDGKTALDLAKEDGNSEAAVLLEAWIAEHGSAEEVAEIQRQEEEQEPEPEAGLQQVPATEKLQELQAVLIAVARAGDVEAVRRCLRDGADPNATDEYRMTAL